MDIPSLLNEPCPTYASVVHAPSFAGSSTSLHRKEHYTKNHDCPRSADIGSNASLDGIEHYYQKHILQAEKRYATSLLPYSENSLPKRIRFFTFAYSCRLFIKKATPISRYYNHYNSHNYRSGEQTIRSPCFPRNDPKDKLNPVCCLR